MPRWNPGDEEDPTNLPDAEEMPIGDPPGPLTSFSQSATRNVVALPVVVPNPVDTVFHATSYLEDLLSLAFRYVRAPAAVSGPTAVALTLRLGQPFDRLIQPAFFERATTRVHQSRIAVEVLRKALDDGTLTPSQFPGSLSEEVAQVSASGESAPDAAANLNDANATTKWLVNTTTGWAQYTLAQPAVAVRYRLQAANDAPERDPKNWQLQGSSDGTTWTTLDTQTAQAFTTRLQVKNFSFANTTAYRHYRFNVTLNNGAPAIQLSNLFLFVADSGTTLPAAKEQRFRGMAYNALLQALGTTYVELRGVRTATSGRRKELANRLGLELGDSRPDRLDLFTISPDEVTDAQLEQLFGYRSTQSGDPMAVPALVPEMLVALRAGLRTVWRRKDEAERDVAGKPYPVIDPDLLSDRDLRGTTSEDRAFDLYSARKNALTSDFDSIFSQLQSAGTLAAFDSVFQNFLPGPALDFDRLSTRHAAGEDVTVELAPFGLSLAAYLQVVTVRSAYSTGAPLASELRDVSHILVQARKIITRFPVWRDEERANGVVLAPNAFAINAVAPTPLPWRGEQAAVDSWRLTLELRDRQARALEDHYQSALESAEAQVLPRLRDGLLTEIGVPLGLSAGSVADRLGRELCVDFRASDGLRTDRVGQAIDSMQSLLVSVRSGVFANFPDALARLSIPANEAVYDAEWKWLESYPRWVAASRAFAYPENQLQPNLFREEDGSPLAPSQHYGRWLKDHMTSAGRITPGQAQAKADAYLAAALIAVPTLPPGLKLTAKRTGDQLAAHRGFQDSLIPGSVHNEADIPAVVRELYWLVPMALARKLRESRQYVAALDWYRTVFNYQAVLANRKIYRGLTNETTIATSYEQPADWLATARLSPHVGARSRQGAYTRATIMAIVECVLAFADSEFTRNTSDANARARVLYQTAIDLLAMPEMAVPATPPSPFPANPLPIAYRAAAEAGLAKISGGLNISGSATPDSFLPSQYRYAAVFERAKALVSTAQQVEAAYFAALERADTENYNLLQAGHDLRVAEVNLDVQRVKVAGADVGITMADMQRQKSQEVSSEMSRRLSAGLNTFEQNQLSHLRSAMDRHLLGGGFSLVGDIISSFAAPQASPASIVGGLFGAAGRAAQNLAERESQFAQIDGINAGYERRQEDWALQRSQAARDVAIGAQQTALAQNQRELALLEQDVSRLNHGHAEAVMNFLANKFTNADLHEWMSGVLGRVYDYFLQQATAMAQLAQAQLAFERQEPPVGFIAADYWQESTVDSASPPDDGSTDRRGLTGSARLLQDLIRLDQHAFQTDRRRLELSQTFSLAQIAAFELEELRQTGVLTFATPQELFDRDFPGHYLRLIKRVQVSLVALLPPTRGVRATLESSGMSRTVVPRPDVAGGPFDAVTLRREPEKIAFTSPIGANGLFSLQPADGTLLLPFEGMGLDTVWQLRLPKAANPFDFTGIADVLFTVEYTALHSDDYRQEVIQRLGRRFRAERSLSIRTTYPDAWYELNNPDTLDDPTQRMRASLPVTKDDIPQHVEGLTVTDLSVFVLWKDQEKAGELSITSLSVDKATTGPVATVNSVASTRRANGDPWRSLTTSRQSPVGDWQIQLPDTAVVRSWFADGLIEDLVLVLSLSGTAPSWT